MEAQIREIIVKALANGEYRDALLHIADVMHLTLPDDVYEKSVLPETKPMD